MKVSPLSLLRALHVSKLHSRTISRPNLDHERNGLRIPQQAFIRRTFSVTSSHNYPPQARTPNLAPRSKDRGPVSKEDTQTDFGALNVLGNTPPPATAVDACLSDGFHLSNGVKIIGGSGCLLLGGEAFSWRPWSISTNPTILNRKRQLEISEEAWGLLDLMWPKPGRRGITFIQPLPNC